jgi:hypothetical protein
MTDFDYHAKLQLCGRHVSDLVADKIKREIQVVQKIFGVEDYVSHPCDGLVMIFPALIAHE